MPKYNVHRVNVYNFFPNAIHCVSYEEDSSKLAISRADFSIEIWNLKNSPFQERVIAPVNGTSVEALCWCQRRLFSTGLSAYVTEYDLCSLNEKSTVPVIGGPAWCLSSNREQTLLAAGTEEGYICLFAVNSDGFTFERRFDKQEGRILCLSWHESGKTLVTGSVDSIRVWNVSTGHAITRMTVSRLKKGTETIVWCLAILSDFTIVSGDSWGRTSFWNGHTGTLLSSSKVHKADVLCLTVGEKEDCVYTSGIDPVICQFNKVRTQSGNKSDAREIWVKSVQRQLHTHDVRALSKAGDYLVSGGVDSHLILSKYPPKTCLKYAPVKQSCIQVSSKARCLLLQYPRCLELWKLGNSSQIEGNDGDVLRLTLKESKVLLLNCSEGEHLTCSALSDDGKWLAYSTNEQIRLYSFALEEDQLTSVPTASLQKIRCLPIDCHLAQVLRFTFSAKYLLMATPTGTIQVVETNLVQPCLVHTFPGPSEGEDRTNIIVCSHDDKFCAASDHLGNVVIYDLQKLEIYCRLPHYRCQATALAFNPHTSNLFVAYSDSKVVEYDVSKKRYSKWSKELGNLCGHMNPYYPILNISFVGKDSSRLIFQDDNTVYALQKESFEIAPADKKRSKTGRDEIDSTIQWSDAVRTTKRYKHLLSFTHLFGNELVAVELSPEAILEKLPSALLRKKFGT